MSSPIVHQMHRHRERLRRVYQRQVYELRHEGDVMGVPGYERAPPDGSLTDRLLGGEAGE